MSEQPAWPPRMTRRSECHCACHNEMDGFGAVHVVPCCEPDPILTRETFKTLYMQTPTEVWGRDMTPEIGQTFEEWCKRPDVRQWINSLSRLTTVSLIESFIRLERARDRRVEGE